MEVGVVFIAWGLASAGIAMWADAWGRSPVAFFFLSFLLSPLLGGLVLAVGGNRAARAVAEAREADAQRREHERQLESLRAVVRAPDIPALSVADELAKLSALVQSGALSQAEFEAEKQRLLRR